MAGLSTNLVAQYHRDGFIVPQYRLSPPDLENLQDLTRHFIAENWEDRNLPLRQPYIAQAKGQSPPPGVWTRYGEQTSSRAEEWRAFSSHAGILDCVESILGPDIILYNTTMFYKDTGGPGTPWHSDGGGGNPINPPLQVNVWLAVFDTNRDNGCLRVIPKSHLAENIGTHNHYADTSPGLSVRLTVSKDEFDENQAQDIPLEAGQMLLFHRDLIHGSYGNDGIRPRAGYTLRYFPATSHWDHATRGNPDPNLERSNEAFRTRPLYLVRGTDRANNNFQIGHIKSVD